MKSTTSSTESRPNKSTIEPRLLKGFRDFLPDEQAARQTMLSGITGAFELCGFAPLSTPAIEYADILLGKYGDEGEKLLYKFEDNGGRQVALRYDLTVPLARVVAQYRDIPKPFRRYQLGTVWRAEKPAHGRFREFMQCDADIIGTASSLADADCIAAGIMGLKSVGL
ncbi:MAG TPA: ATP phosphoribosyltransferase regulatory subunit, partial [Myxococcota bacterium]|nr:ATP phosphoribosyltransferase regulatory subunit [Myxococcota bacterium]